MTTLALQSNASGTGILTLSAPNTDSTLTVNIAAVSGTLTPLVANTVITASGSSVDFTNIPSWVRRITLVASDMSFAAASGGTRIRVGSGSLATTGYLTSGLFNGTFGGLTDGLGALSTSSTNLAAAHVTLTHLGNNIWVSTGTTARYSDSGAYYFCGRIALSGVLDRLSVVATTSTFTGGSVNIIYE